jgi:tetratricopeptide (TPR) repeat protein
MTYTPLELAQAFIQTGELEDALDALNQQLTDQPDDENSRRLRIAVLLQLRGDDHLQTALADSQQLTDLSAEDYVRRSLIFERLDEVDSALRVLGEARALAPNDERLVERHLHLLLLLQDDLTQARELVASQPQTWRWLQWAGDLAMQAGEQAAAVTHYSAALTQLEARFDLAREKYARAMQARLLLTRADAFRHLEHIEQAEADYKAAAAIIPDEPLIPFGRGLVAALRGDMSTAIALCQEALSQANATLRNQMCQGLNDKRYQELLALLGEVL